MITDKNSSCQLSLAFNESDKCMLILTSGTHLPMFGYINNQQYCNDTQRYDFKEAALKYAEISKILFYIQHISLRRLSTSNTTLMKALNYCDNGTVNVRMFQLACTEQQNKTENRLQVLLESELLHKCHISSRIPVSSIQYFSPPLHSFVLDLYNSQIIPSSPFLHSITLSVFFSFLLLSISILSTAPSTFCRT